MARSATTISQVHPRAAREVPARGARGALSRAAAVAWLLAFASTFLTRGALAEPAPDATVVRVAVAGSRDAVTQLRESLSELLGRLGLDVVVRAGADETSLSPNPDALARAFIDLRTPTAARVVVLRGDAPQELERRTLPTAASLDVSIEAASHVLYMIVESALHAREAARAEASQPAAEASPPPSTKAGPSPAAESPPEPQPGPKRRHHAENDDEADEAEKPPPHRETPRGIDLTVAVHGGAAAFDASRLLPGFGVGLDGGARYGTVRTSAMIAVRAFLPEDVTRQGQQASLRAETARLLVAVEWTVVSRVAIGALAGGGLDRLTLAAGPSTTQTEAVGTESRVDPMMEFGLLGKVRFSRTASAYLHLAFGVDLAPHRYVIEDEGLRTTFFAPSRVRPALFLGIAFPLLEEGSDE